jgi:hypothetical protein
MTTRPAIPAPPYQGGCLCGQVRYTLNARPLALNACHCTDCQKLTGATNFLVVIAPSEAFSSSGETQSYIKRADSGRELDIRRCPNCGTRLWHHNLSNPALVFVAAGTLDDPGWVVPTSHIWVKRASPAALIHDDALVMDGPPADRALLMDAFAKVYG